MQMSTISGKRINTTYRASIVSILLLSVRNPSYMRPIRHMNVNHLLSSYVYIEIILKLFVFMSEDTQKKSRKSSA